MESAIEDTSRIKALDKASIHRISSGQVVIDLQTAVKELVENSLDAGATSIEVRFKQYGVTGIEVIDNGCGIAEKDWESVGLKYYTSKLATFDDLSTVRTFGFRGEAISSLCALCDTVTVMTATSGPMGIQLDLERSGKVAKQTKVARQRGTTVQFTGLFAQLPVRRKELQRNMKREFGKALGLLNAYALGPCAGMDGSGRGVRLTVTNQSENGKKIEQIKTNGTPSFKASLTALWGPKAMENMVELDLNFRFQQEKSALRRRHAESQGSQTQGPRDDDIDDAIPIQVKGLISKFSVGAGRTGTDRQFFYVNGRPCNLAKVQKAFNEVYRTFNTNQAPFVLADFIVPTECCDINVSPDKRTIFLQSEDKLIDALKVALETEFSQHRSTFDLNPTSMSQRALTQTTFDSPFSKRLNLKAGSGLVKSQSLPTPASSKDKEKVPPPGRAAREALFLPEPVSDEADGAQAAPAAQQESITDEADTQGEPRIPAKDKSLPSPIPATSKDNERLSEPGRTAGEKSFHPKPLAVPDEAEAAPAAPAGAEKSRTDEADTRGEARKPAEETDIGDEPDSTERLDHMDIDEGESPEKCKEMEVGQPVVLDTTRAAWGRKKLAPISDKRPDDFGEPQGASEEPATKKRRVEVEGAQTDADTGAGKLVRKPSSKSGEGTTSLDSLRNRLAGFARGGLLPTTLSSKKEPRARGEETEAEDVEGAEGKTFGKDVRKGRARRPSFEIIGPSFKTIVLREEQRPAGGVDKTRARSDSDTIMEDAIPSMSSTTAPPEHHPSSKVIEMDDEQDLASETSTKQSGQRPEIIRGSDTASGNVTLRFDFERLTSAWTRLRNGRVVGAEGAPCVSSKVSADAGVANTEDNESATRALARVIEKADFANMDVIGQFNLGFIIVRRQKAAACDDGDQMDDLFIVDQHASDEKYNFETLQQTTRIQSQKLFRPRPLELTAADELVAIENMHVLQQNGFELAVDETAAVGQGTKLKVTAFPVSKSTEFGMADLEELLNLMRDQPSGNVVRCSKARAMFAMRACRKSVMIGMPLNKSQMMTVVQHMGTIEQPWNCPHGRPTMRHLFDLCQDGLRREPRTVIWSSLEGM